MLRAATNSQVTRLAVVWDVLWGEDLSSEKRCLECFCTLQKWPGEKCACCKLISAIKVDTNDDVGSIFLVIISRTEGAVLCNVCYS